MATTEGAVTTTAKPAKKAAARKAPAKKAAAKVTAKKAVAKTTTGKKIRWAVGQVFPNGKNQAGVGHGGVQYKIVRASNGEFIAGSVVNGKTTELDRGTFSKAYWACVEANKTAVAKTPAKRAAKAVA